MSLVPIDSSNAVAVTSYLAQARDWLARAVDETGPEQIAAAKAEIATAAEATKQLGLSKEIQLDAQEMVRRAEYALGKAIRRGQAEGTVAKRGDIGAYGSTGLVGAEAGSRRNGHLARVTDFGTPGELYGTSAAAGGALTMADGAEPEQFDAAIAEAKAEGNLSRANVVRKIKQRTAPASGDEQTPVPSPEDAATIALLNDIRGPWSKGITHAARHMTPKARAHLIEALENTLAELRRIQ